MTKLYNGPIVDAHHHLWDLNSGRYDWLSEPRDTVFGTTAPLMSNYLLDDYQSDMSAINLVKSVHIQASFGQKEGAAETKWLQSVAKDGDFPHGIVAYSPLDVCEIEECLEMQCQHPNVRGIRQIMSWHKNPTWTFVDRPDLMFDDAWRRGFNLLQKYNLSFDMMIFSGQLPDVLGLARDFPDTQIILNHTGSPADRDVDGISQWKDGMTALASAANVSVKISDLGAYDHNWTLDSIRPFVLHTIDVFGTNRCMFASDLPVARLHGNAEVIYDSFKVLASEFSESEQQALFHDNAINFYRLA